MHIFIYECQQLSCIGFSVCYVHLYLLAPNTVLSSLHYDNLFIGVEQRIVRVKKLSKHLTHTTAGHFDGTSSSVEVPSPQMILGLWQVDS